MGFVLTIVYISLIYITPAEIMPALAPFGVQVMVVALAGLASLPVVWSGEFRFRGPHLRLLAGLLAAIAISMLIGQRWPGGILSAWKDFLPSLAVFLLIILNVSSLRQLQTLQTSLVLVALFLVVRAAIGFHSGDPAFVFQQGGEGSSEDLVLRLRARGIIADPNDFAQFLLMMIPLTWMRWRPRQWIENGALVLVPTAILLYGMLLTRSRGGLVGLALVAALSVRSHVGCLGGGAIGATVAGALLIANFTGGREVSVEGGVDRLDIWAEGLQMVKGSPIWGVGYRNFTDNTPLTAHNSFLLCAAELGLPGYLAWLALFVVSLLQLRALEQGGRDGTEWGRAVAAQSFGISLVVFALLTTSWFLSRAYQPTPFLALGMAAALAEMETRHSSRPLLGPFRDWALLTVVAGLGILVAIYMAVRLRALL